MAQCIHLNFTSNQAQANKHTRFFFPWFFLLFVFFFFFFLLCWNSLLHKRQQVTKKASKSDKATKRPSERDKQSIVLLLVHLLLCLPTNQTRNPPPLSSRQAGVLCVGVCVCVCVCCVWALCVCGRCVLCGRGGVLWLRLTPFTTTIPRHSLIDCLDWLCLAPLHQQENTHPSTLPACL